MTQHELLSQVITTLDKTQKALHDYLQLTSSLEEAEESLDLAKSKVNEVMELMEHTLPEVRGDQDDV